MMSAIDIEALWNKYHTLYNEEWPRAYEQYRGAYNRAQKLFDLTDTGNDRLQAARSQIESVRQRLADLQRVQDEISATLDRAYEIIAQASSATRR